MNLKDFAELRPYPMKQGLKYIYGLIPPRFSLWQSLLRYLWFLTRIVVVNWGKVRRILDATGGEAVASRL